MNLIKWQPSRNILNDFDLMIDNIFNDGWNIRYFKYNIYNQNGEHYKKYEEDKYLADIETLAILMVQMMKRKGLNDDSMSEREISRLEPFERFY